MLIVNVCWIDVGDGAGRQVELQFVEQAINFYNLSTVLQQAQRVCRLFPRQQPVLVPIRAVLTSVRVYKV
jgi:hypothetical protein